MDCLPTFPGTGSKKTPNSFLSCMWPSAKPQDLLTHLLSQHALESRTFICLCHQTSRTKMAFSPISLSLLPFIFSKSARKIKYYGVILDYLISSIIKSAYGNLSHTSLSIIHYIDTLIKSEVGRIKC